MPKLTIRSVARDMYSNLNLRHSADGGGGCVYFLSVSQPWQEAILYAAHLGRTPNFSSYNYIDRFLGEICTIADDIVARSLEDELFQLKDLLYKRESYIDAHDLTAWLASNTANIDYLTDALEYDPEDGLAALKQAHSCFLSAICSALFDGIIKYIGEND